MQTGHFAYHSNRLIIPVIWGTIPTAASQTVALPTVDAQNLLCHRVPMLNRPFQAKDAGRPSSHWPVSAARRQVAGRQRLCITVYSGVKHGLIKNRSKVTPPPIKS